MIKKIVFFILAILFVLVNVNTAHADVTACNPADPKPQKLETRIGTISVTPDIIPVGEIMTVMVQTVEPTVDVYIAVPTNTEIADYSPKNDPNITFSNGKFSRVGTTSLPAGSYAVMFKVNHWSAKKWLPIYYSATNVQGTGQGQDAFFAYYDKIPFTIALDDRNQVAQTTKDVVRKVTVTGAKDVATTLTIDKGYVGTTISEKTGPSATTTALSDGTTTFFIFSQEGAKIKLTASSADTCSDSSVIQSFTVVRSDVANNYKPSNAWIYYTGGGVVLLGLLLFFFLKRRKKEGPTPPANSIPPTTPTNPTI